MPVSGYIQIQFIANYPTNNLYWRIGAGAYTGPIVIDCTPTFGTFVPGSVCTYTISPVSFEFESCDSVVFNGFLEATCNEDGDLGYIYWTKTFTPSPECTPVEITCVGEDVTGQVVSSAVTYGGQYGLDPTLLVIQNCINPILSSIPNPPGTVVCGNFNGKHQASSCGGASPFYCYCIYKPNITIVGAGVGATAEAVMGYGGLTKPALILNAGVGSPTLNAVYTNVPCNTPTNFIPNPAPAPSTQGIGIQTFTVTVTNGQVTSVVPDLYPNQGKFFYFEEHFEFDPALIGGVIGVLCKPDPTSIDLGKVIAIEITNPGSGYTSFPAPVISADEIDATCDLNLNDKAVLTATVGDGTGPCPGFDPGMGCFDTPYYNGVLPSLPVGATLLLCYKDIPASIPPEYTVTPAGGCCYDCLQIEVTPDPFEPLPLIIYTECTTFELIVYQATSYTAFTINCVVNNSWYSSQPSTQFVELGLCIT